MGTNPAWSKNELFGSKMINARIETVTTKPSFKNLIPKIDALFYLMDITNGNKVAVEKCPFSFKERAWPDVFAGLWTTWSMSSKRILRILY